MSIAVLGSVNIDFTANVARMPQAGQTIHAHGFDTGLGGKGANQAVAAQKLSGEEVRFVACLGADALGAEARARLSAEGVSERFLSTVAEPTGVALIHVDAQGQNSITVAGGANLALALPRTHAWLEQGRIALFQLESPMAVVEAGLKAARAAGLRTVLDPAPVPQSDVGHLLALADIVTPNETETEALTGILPVDEASAFAAAQALLARGCGLAVVKRGAEGLCWANAEGERGTVAPFRVATTNTVAAGDCFNGALAAALAEGQSEPEALRFAAAAAALSTTRPGAISSLPARSEVDALLAAVPA